MIGRTTFGQEYQAYRFANCAVVMFIASFNSDCRAPGLSKQKKFPNPRRHIRIKAITLWSRACG